MRVRTVISQPLPGLSLRMRRRPWKMGGMIARGIRSLAGRPPPHLGAFASAPGGVRQPPCTAPSPIANIAGPSLPILSAPFMPYPASTDSQSHRFCTAAMIVVSDRHFRYLCRLMSRRARLYTEMITTGALLHGEPARWLSHHPAEQPLALQLGGSDPAELAACARLGEEWGCDEINLNCGCPSDRVQSGRFGACLMAEPALVADCVAAMVEAVRIPVTVKHRIGIDD